jgi:hypothetical protein
MHLFFNFKFDGGLFFNFYFAITKKYFLNSHFSFYLGDKSNLIISNVCHGSFFFLMILMIPNFRLYNFFLLKHEYLIVKYLIIKAYGYKTIVKVTN